MSGRLTKAEVAALHWFNNRPHASRFGVDDPSRRVRDCLRKRGFIEVCGAERGPVPLTKFRISEAGRTALNTQVRGHD